MTSITEPNNHGISVIIPCLNEAESIGPTIEMVRRGLAKLRATEVGQNLKDEIIVVDNGSTDCSAQIALEHGARVLKEEQRGYGAALRHGFANARYNIMVMGDGDLSYNFEEMDALVLPLLKGQADFAIGNRMKSIQPGAMPALHRYLGNPILSMMLRVMFHNHSVRDAHCGLRAITRAAYEQLRCVTTGMEFASEMVVRAIRCHLRIVEHDIDYHPRLGSSKLRSFRDGWRHLRFMILHSPTLFLLVPGLLFWGLGLAMTLPLAFGPIILDQRMIDIHYMLIGGVLNIIGIQIITIGLLAKAYGHLSGLHEDPVIARFYRWFSFEKMCLLAGLAMIAGIVIICKVFWEWVASGFGDLNQPRLLFFAIMCLINGVQVGAASFLFSIMALPRHLDQMPPHSKDTGIVDT